MDCTALTHTHRPAHGLSITFSPEAAAGTERAQNGRGGMHELPPLKDRRSAAIYIFARNGQSVSRKPQKVCAAVGAETRRRRSTIGAMLEMLALFARRSH